jgi:hypothetical protein
MIYIDFQGGAHGNYLEYICNRFLAKVEVNDSPFNSLGSAHNKKYKTTKHFSAWHYFDYRGIKTYLFDSKIISIQISSDDLLNLTCVSLLRAADCNIDNDLLEIDTYNKLDNINYRWVLDTLINCFFQDTRIKDYYNVKDTSWPDIHTLNDFENLPEHILSECQNVFKLFPPKFSKEFPDCPRNILREFFKIGFCYPESQGFMTRQKMMTYDNSNDVYVFPYSCFYDLQKFSDEVNKMSQWANYNFSISNDFVSLHNNFLEKQIYKDVKSRCDMLYNQILNQEQFILPKLTLLEESYLESRLEKHYNKVSPVDAPQWFVSSDQIVNYYTEKL